MTKIFHSSHEELGQAEVSGRLLNWAKALGCSARWPAVGKEGLCLLPSPSQWPLLGAKLSRAASLAEGRGRVNDCWESVRRRL